MIRLVIIVALLVVIGGTLFVAASDPAKLPSKLQPFAPKMKQVLDSGIQGTHTALSRTKDVQPAVLGAKSESSRIFQEDTAGKPLHQQAMEFTQYEYCKMVVKSYEADQSKPAPTDTPTDTPTPTPEKE